MKETEIDAEITRAKGRIIKLKELLRLRRQADALEKRYLYSNGALGKEFNRIAEIVTRHFDVPFESVIKHDRQEKYVIPRHVVIQLVRERTGAPLQAIGDVIGRDHSMIHFACQRIEERVSVDSKFAAEVDMLRKACDRNGAEKSLT